MHSGPRPSSRPLQDLDLGGCFLASFALAFAMIRQAKITISEPRKAAMRSSNVTFNSPRPRSILNSLKNAPPITAPTMPTRRFAQRPNPSFFIVTTRPAKVPAKPPTMIHKMIWPIFMTWILPHMTCTETSIRSKASGGPSHVPERGQAFSCSRATPTETCSKPASLLFVGSKPRQPAPGI